MKTVLVTGGAGYIGSHAAKCLLRMGYLPVTYDNLSRGHADFVKWGPLEIGQLSDTKKLYSVFEIYKPDAVLHFAAFAYVGESIDNPGMYYQNNVSETISLLEAMVKFGVRKLVYSSSCATYGIPIHLPITEETLQNPINPYGRSKLMVEQMLKDYELTHGLSSVCLRYFNAAGADSQGEIGEDHDPETHLIPILLDVAMGLRPCAFVLGNDYPTKDGTCIRDYVHVTDLAEAHALSLGHLDRGEKSVGINLGNGVGFSVLDIVNAVRKVTGHPVPTVTWDRRVGDPPELVSDASKAKRILGWSPKFESLEEIIYTAWKWHQKLQDVRKYRTSSF